MRSLLLVTAACIVLLMVMAQQLAMRVLFQPRPSSYGPDESILSIPASDGQSIAAYVGYHSPEAYTIFFLHGNAEDIGNVMPLLRSYELKGFNVATFDYRGYGLTPGEPSEKSSYDDAETVYDYLLEHFKIDEDKMVLHGRSLGGGVAMEIAKRRNPKGLILESTFLSAFKVVLPFKWIPGDYFKNESKVKATQCRALIIHGDRDEVVPFSHGKALAAAFGPDRAKAYWVEGAGHNNLASVAGQNYFFMIEKFISDLDSN